MILLPATAIPQSPSVWDNIPENIRQRSAFKRHEWFYRQRAFPSDTIPVEQFYRTRAREMARTIASPSALTWTPIGPRSLNSTWPPLWGEMSGRVRGVAVHPTDPSTVYIGAAGGGTWKTTNGGTSWVSLSDDFPNITFGAIAIDPTNPNVVYAGTGEVIAGSNLQAYDGRGLFKSTNAGATWTQITNGFGTQTAFGDIEVDPFDSNIVIAALGRGYTFVGPFPNEGIWRSTDAGTTWARVQALGNSTEVLFHPTTNGRVFAAGWNSPGVVVSNDHGATWTASSTGLPATGITRIQLTIAQSQPLTMYAFHSSNNGGLTRAYKSTNGGTNWSQISSGVQLGGTYDGTNWIDQGWYDATIAVKPNDPNFVLLGNIEVHRATDGATFSPLRSSSGPFGGTRAWDNMTHTDIHKIVFAPSNPNIAYVGCDGGVYKSTDGGNTWQSANAGIATIQYYRIASHPSNRNIIIGGAQDNGNYRTLDGGATPWSITTTGDGMECFFDHTDPNFVFVSTQNGNLLRSTSGGAYATFGTISPPWEVTPNWTTPWLMHPTNNNILYAGSRRIWRSTNRGGSWEAISPSIAASDVLNSIAIGRTNPSNMIAVAGGYANANPQVLISTDGGFTWRDVTANIPGPARHIARALVHPLDAGAMFIVRSGFGSGKVYASYNLGQSWTNLSGNLPDVPASDLFIDPQRPRAWYLATDIGIYSTTNGGATWERDNNGMPTVPMIDFDYFSSGGTRLLRLGTHGRSAYEAPLPLEPNASIFVTPIAKTFGRVEANIASDTAVATIYNVGSQSLTVSSVTNNNAAFAVSGLPSLPALVAPQGSLQFRVIFRPVAHGVVSDSLRIVSNDAAVPTTIVPLTGSGIVIGRAQKGVLYTSGNGSLYNVNTTTGAATLIGAFGVPQVDALGIHPSSKELYGMTSTPLSTQFYRISQQFGDALPLRTIPLGSVRAFAFSANSTLFGATSTGSLYRINLTTGDTTFIGNNALSYAGLTFSPLTDVLWASVRPPLTNRDRIYTISTTTGAATLIGATGDGAITPSIAFNPLGVLYGLKGSSTQVNTLIRIDTTTGAGTLIGSTGVAGMLSITMRTDSLTTSVQESKPGIPSTFALHQNYPNPFNPTTRIAFDLPNPAFVTLKVFDILGREVLTLVDEFQTGGYKSVTMSARGVPSGAYIYRLTAGSFSDAKKLLLIR
jgi:photosystem II stability/assembly factor-like uncharacterized protein